METTSVSDKPARAAKKTRATTRLSVARLSVGSSMQRLQIGIAGVLIVILLIGFADMLLSGASNEAPIDPPIDAIETVPGGDTAGAKTTPGEPLADLGVAPEVSEEEKQADRKDSEAREKKAAAKARSEAQ